jgi:hypothetical protein
MRVRLPAEGGCAPRDQPLRGSTVRVAGPLFWVDLGCHELRAVSEYLGDDLVRDALAAELSAEGHGTTWTGPIAALDPGSGEGEIVEVADLDEPLEDLLDDGQRIAQVDQALASLLHRTRTHGEERCGSLHHRIGFGDRRPASTPCLGCLAAFLWRACSVGHLLGLGDALHGDVDVSDLRADLVLELLDDVLVGAQELLGLLAALTETDVAIVEPGA